MARTAPAEEREGHVTAAATELLGSDRSFADVAQAASEVDPELVADWVTELREVLKEDPESTAELECLVALGLHHAELLEQNRVQPEREARHLALLLADEGRADRAIEVLEYLLARTPDNKEIETDLAEMMRKAGRGDELVESYLQQARSEAARGHTDEAVRWLQEVLVIDRSRRDVQRMIRDLRFEDTYRSMRWSRLRHALGRFCVTMLKLAVVVGILAAATWRDLRVRDRFQALPPADLTDLDSVRGRLMAVDDFIRSHRVWSGVLQASHERGELRSSVHRLEGEAAERARREADAQLVRQAMVDSALERGRMAITAGKYDTAIAEFEAALELAGPAWERADEVRADVEAIRAFNEERQ